jgi:hypothetical protein
MTFHSICHAPVCPPILSTGLMINTPLGTPDRVCVPAQTRNINCLNDDHALQVLRATRTGFTAHAIWNKDGDVGEVSQNPLR